MVNLQTDFIWCFTPIITISRDAITIFEKIWKSSSKIHVNHLLTLQICKPKLKLYVSSSPYTKFLLIQYILHLLIFTSPPNCFCVCEQLFTYSRLRIYFLCTLIFVNWAKTSARQKCIFVKLKNICKTLDDFRDVLRYPTAIETCKHSTNDFQKT